MIEFLNLKASLKLWKLLAMEKVAIGLDLRRFFNSTFIYKFYHKF